MHPRVHAAVAPPARPPHRIFIRSYERVLGSRSGPLRLHFHRGQKSATFTEKRGPLAVAGTTLTSRTLSSEVMGCVGSKSAQALPLPVQREPPSNVGRAILAVGCAAPPRNEERFLSKRLCRNDGMAWHGRPGAATRGGYLAEAGRSSGQPGACTAAGRSLRSPSLPKAQPPWCLGLT